MTVRDESGAGDDNALHLLIVEDDMVDYEALLRTLSRCHFNVRSTHATDVRSSAMILVEGGHFDCALVDYRLTDGTGLDVVQKAEELCKAIPFIIFTGLDDKNTAIKSLREGVQDYLTKTELTPQVLERAIRYAIERQQLRTRLLELREAQQRKNEIASMERLSTLAGTSVTAETFGLRPLKIGSREMFEQFVDLYFDLLHQSLMQQSYKTEYSLSEKFRELADNLGFLNAGPRDLVDIHSEAMRRRIKQMLPNKARAYVGESSMVILQLMGYLASYYRNHALLARSRGRKN